MSDAISWVIMLKLKDAEDPIGFNVYGNPNAATREALTGAGAQIFGPFGGFG